MKIASLAWLEMSPDKFFLPFKTMENTKITYFLSRIVFMTKMTSYKKS